MFALLFLRFFKGGPFLVIRMFYGRVGLQGLYLTFLEETQEQLSKALQIIAEAEGGVAVNCMLGKDRTGTLSALILMALDVPTERICYDYSLTEKYLSREYISALLKPVNLDSEVLASAKKGTMNQMIAYMVVQYGGVDNYLNGIGFDAKWRVKLRANFTEPSVRAD